MKKIELEEKEVLECIMDMIASFKESKIKVGQNHFHHNCTYNKAASIIQYGILSVQELNDLGIVKYTPKELSLLNEEGGHANGINNISLSKTGLFIERYEFEYDPYKPNSVDIIVSETVPAYRMSSNYGNEFLAQTSISNNMFKSIDIRLLELIDKVKYYKTPEYIKEEIIKIVNNYNCIREVALAMNQETLPIPLREMSNYKDEAGFELNKDEIVKAPKIILK